jgi:hypothetical protein
MSVTQQLNSVLNTATQSLPQLVQASLNTATQTVASLNLTAAQAQPCITQQNQSLSALVNSTSK